MGRKTEFFVELSSFSYISICLYLSFYLSIYLSIYLASYWILKNWGNYK